MRGIFKFAPLASFSAKRTKAKDLISSGHVKNVAKIYGSEDSAKYGQFERVLCQQKT